MLGQRNRVSRQCLPWQLGVTPAADGFSDDLNGARNGAGSIFAADYSTVLPFGARAFVGGTFRGSFLTRGSPTYGSSWHVGLMRFLSPTLAVRAQFQSSGWNSEPSATDQQIVASIDQYIDRRAGPMTELPGRGTVEVSGSAYARVTGLGEQGIYVALAPFVTSWLQIGATAQYFRAVFGPNDAVTAHDLMAYFRLYAPLSPKLMPFVGGRVGSSTFDGQSGGFSNYSGSVGVRHWIRQGLAAELGMRLLAHRDEGGFYPHSPNEFTAFANIVLPVELRAGRR